MASTTARRRYHCDGRRGYSRALADDASTPGQPSTLKRLREPAAGRHGAPSSRRPASIAAGGLDALIFRVLQTGALVLLVVVTGRLMEPAGRGLYAIASLTVTLCGIPFGGVWLANSVELARGRASPRELLGSSLVLAAVGGLAIGLVAFAIAPLLGDRWWLVALPAAVTPFQLLGRYLEGLYTALGHVRAASTIILGRAVLPLLFITPPLLAGASARTAIAFWTLQVVALPLLTFFPLRSLLGGPQLPRDRRLYRRVVSYGVKLSGINAVGLLNERVGLIALAAFATDAAVGVYSIAVAGAQILLLVTESLVLSTFSHIGGRARDSSATLTLRTIRHTSLLATAGGLLLLPIAFVAVPPVLGAGYENVPLIYAILIPSGIGYAVIQPLLTFFQVQAQRPALVLTAAGAALVVNVLLAMALAATWGPWGAAAATSLSSCFGAAVAYWCFCREAGTRIRNLRPGRVELRDYRELLSAVARRVRRA